MNPGFRSNFPLWDNGSHSYEDQSRYRPGQLFWNRDHNDGIQQFAHNFVPTAAGKTAGLAPFQYVPGLQITAGQRTMSGQNWLLTGQILGLPDMLSGHLPTRSEKF